MSQNQSSQRFPLSEWQPEMLRLTAFPSPADQIGQQDWWHDLVGSPADKTEIDNRVGVRTEEGLLDDGQLSLSVHSTRIDWRYRANSPEDLIIANMFPVLGPFPAYLDIFRDTMLRWLKSENVPTLTRLAFGAILLKPVSEPREIFEIYSDYLPIEFDKENTRDFLYQINRRRTSSTGIPGQFNINRLNKWAAAQLAITETTSTGATVRRPHKYACRLELDINTIAELGVELDRTLLPSLFDELIGFAKEIVREGDIP